MCLTRGRGILVPLAQLVARPPAGGRTQVRALRGTLPDQEVDVDDYDELVKKYQVLKWFKYQHLPPALQEISRGYCELAFAEARRIPVSNAETAVALRKLLEAKDAAVRASVP